MIDLDVTGVAHGGVFVGRHQGRVVFVPDAIPGERVRVRVTDTTKASFWRGEVLDVVEASPHRRAHVWRAADLDVAPEHRPGGADLGHIELGHQRELKREVVRDALQRIGRLDLPVTIEPAHPARDAAGADIGGESADGTGWRTRVSLHVDDRGRIGPFAARSHRVIEVPDLPLATPGIADAAREMRGGDPGRIDLVQPADGRVRMLRSDGAGARRGGHGRGHRDGTRRQRGGGGDRLRPARLPAGADRQRTETVVETVAGRAFHLDVGGFWQVHRLAAQTLTDVVTDALAAAGVDPDGQHLDLYGGVGLLAAAVAAAGGVRVTSVETDPRATEHAGENLSGWLGARAETGRVDRWLAATAQSATDRQRQRLTRGIVVLDPPRAGAGREVVHQITQLRPAHVVYVACDPVALARDLATFAAGGYRAQTARALDLFPHSHHVETVALLARDGR